jgi:hypothetical protein
MNTFDLKIIDSDEIPFAPITKEPGMVVQQIWIDGIHLAEPHMVSVSELVRSLDGSGDFYIFTCKCGMPECDRIYEGIKVSHVSGKILWNFRCPVSEPDTDLPEDEALELRLSTSKLVEYEFDRDQFIQAMDKALRELKSKPENSAYSPYGFTRKHLDVLNVIGRPVPMP